MADSLLDVKIRAFGVVLGLEGGGWMVVWGVGCGEVGDESLAVVEDEDEEELEMEEEEVVEAVSEMSSNRLETESLSSSSLPESEEDSDEEDSSSSDDSISFANVPPLLLALILTAGASPKICCRSLRRYKGF